jgi:Regulator of ribonuclease activity B
MTLSGFFGRLIRGKPPRDTAALDELVLKQLRGLGCDLTQARHVRHFLYFEEASLARRAADELELADYTATVKEPSDDVSVWTVVGEGFRVIGPETVPGFRAWFEQLAAEHRGEYDGWEPATKP